VPKHVIFSLDHGGTHLWLQVIERGDQHVIGRVQSQELIHQQLPERRGIICVNQERREVSYFELGRQPGQFRQYLRPHRRRRYPPGPRVRVHHVHGARLHKERRACRAVPPRHTFRRPLYQAIPELGPRRRLLRRLRRRRPGRARRDGSPLLRAAPVGRVPDAGRAPRAGVGAGPAGARVPAESAPDAIESGEPLPELKQWVNVALNGKWEENDVDAMVGACHSRMNVIPRPGCAAVMF
jgi:hypothetical protein